MKKILITPRSLTRDGDPALSILQEKGYELVLCTPGVQPSEEELLSLVPGCSGYLAGVEKVSEKVLEVAGDLQVISRNGTGVDSIDLTAAERLGIRIERAQGANARGVAELAVGLMFSLIRSIPFSDAVLKSGGWKRRKGIEIEGKTIGLIGCGKIGKQTAAMALGLGMNVVAYDAYPDSEFQPSDNFRFTDLDQVFARGDIISLHCPPLESGAFLINSASIEKMKKGIYIINTARAALIDEEAVLTGLKEGKIAGFASDVFAEEPPQPSPLYSHEQVITTPHIGGYTAESVSRATLEAVNNLLKVLEKGE